MIQRTAIIERAQQLLWVVVRCDVENLASQRRTAMEALAEVEATAEELGIRDLYGEIALMVQ